MERMVSVLKALSDQNRLRVVAALQTHAELCACQITEMLQVTGATVSRHMGILLRADLVESRKDGRWTFFRMKAAPESGIQPLLNWIAVSFKNCPERDHDRRELQKILSLGKEALCRKQRGEACCPTPVQEET